MRLLRASGAFALLLLPIDLPERMAQAFQRSPERPNRTVRGQVSKNATLGGILDNVISRPRIHDLVETARPVYDLKRLTAGRPYGVSVRADGQLDGFSYGIDDLKTLRVLRKDGQLQAEIVERHYDVKIETASGTVRTSLFGAIEDAGEQDQLALDLADIFAWDVDFNTEVQRGDSFRVSVEKLTLDGKFVRYGRILAAEFQNGARKLQALRYEARNGPGYYAPSGAPLRKAFLRSPLKFTRISSGFTGARYHPILGRTTAHYGIDYAAPHGTPVNASADGVVTLAGNSGGLGNTVKLRHPNGFETQYGHLSKLLVRPGQRVMQGAAIGLVGSTGLSTGPHLHYIMFRNGAYANPLKVQLPPAEPIPEEEREDFERVRMVAMRLLSTSPAPMAAAALLQAAPGAATVLRR
jgi:murein DD-endopeptidase MepM/ murein hydrolase activator NlpD